MCWTSGYTDGPWFDVLNCEEASSKKRMDAYHAWLVEMKVLGEKKNPIEGSDGSEQDETEECKAGEHIRFRLTKSQASHDQ